MKINIFMKSNTPNMFDRFFEKVLEEGWERVPNRLDDGETPEQVYRWKDNPPNKTRELKVRNKFDCKWFIMDRTWGPVKNLKKASWLEWNRNQLTMLPNVRGLYLAYEDTVALWFQDSITEEPCILTRFLHTTVQLDPSVSTNYPKKLVEDAIIDELTSVVNLPVKGFTGTVTDEKINLSLQHGISGFVVKPEGIHFPTKLEIRVDDQGRAYKRYNENEDWRGV